MPVNKKKLRHANPHNYADSESRSASRFTLKILRRCFASLLVQILALFVKLGWELKTLASVKTAPRPSHSAKPLIGQLLKAVVALSSTEGRFVEL